VFVGDDFPELGTDLVTALTGLNMDNLSHVLEWLWLWWLKRDTEASRNGKRFRASQWQTLSAR